MAYLQSRDQRSVSGRNLRLVCDESGLDPLVYGPRRIKEALMSKMPEPPESDKWRLPYLAKLLDQRQVSQYRGDREEEERIQILVDSLCTS